MTQLGLISAGSRLAASSQSDAAVRWGLLIGIGGAILLTVLLAVMGRAFVIGMDQRISTSKTVSGIWTIVVAGALAGFVYADLLGHPQALANTNYSGVVGQYALLFGGPLGAAIAAKGIVTKQVAGNASAKSPADGPKLLDLVSDDAGNTDLGDLQYVLFNVVALLFVLGSLVIHPSGGLPHIPDVLLGLTSVSAVGFVSKKALVPSAVTTGTVEPAEGRAATPVVVTVRGLAPPSQKNAAMWLRFGDEPGAISTAEVKDGETRLTSAAPQQSHSLSTQPVTVCVITANGTIVDAGKFTYQPA